MAWLDWVEMSDDYCELCELPKSQCVHGMPAPPPTPPKPASQPRVRKKVASPTASRSAAARRWTPPEHFKPAILSVLEGAGGELEADRLFEELEAVVREDLKPADVERTPEGELRWQYAARRARVALIEEGLMTKSRPGHWQLAGH